MTAAPEDPLTSRGERLSDLRRRAHAEWEPWIIEAEPAEETETAEFIEKAADPPVGKQAGQ